MRSKCLGTPTDRESNHDPGGGGRCFAFCVILLMRNAFCLSFQLPPRGPSDRLMGTCRWMGSHFHGWIDYNGFLFSLELLEWDSTFLGFGGSENSGK